ncbi:MAG: DUF5677 domain-containing protein [Sedimentisphaerales bacterium]
MGIDEAGFLSPEIEEWIKKHHTQFEEYFALCLKLNNLGQGLMLDICPHDKNGPEIALGCLLIRAMGDFQAVILLSERGMIPQAKVILRCLIEVMFGIVAISKDKNYAIDFVKASIRQGRLEIEACKKNVSCFTDEEKTILEERDEQIQKEKTQIGEGKIIVEKTAKKAELEEYYDSVYRGLSSSVHIDPRDLERTHTSLDKKELSWGPDSKGKDIKTVLLIACDVIFKAFDGIYKVLDTQEEAKENWIARFAELKQVYHKLFEKENKSNSG